jgi:hypothetical protein
MTQFHCELRIADCGFQIPAVQHPDGFQILQSIRNPQSEIRNVKIGREAIG